jgi:cyclic pyranopterin phosphate synthase
MTSLLLNQSWRKAKSAAFDLHTNSTARRTLSFDLWGRRVNAYANANLSIYSAQRCNARCRFCVEELRPASRGTELTQQKSVETNDDSYFTALAVTLEAVRPLNPSVSITGGEPSKDPRLPGVVRLLQCAGARKRTITTNGSGLLDWREGRQVIDWLIKGGLSHLNISRAHVDHARNAELMRLRSGLDPEQLCDVVARAHAGGLRPRLSCVLLQEGVHSLEGIVSYLEFAKSIGIDNVIFRQLMQTDSRTVAPNDVVNYSDKQRVRLEPILEAISADERFAFQRQIIGYYYYVEVWRWRGIDVVLEEADLAQLENTKRTGDAIIHELVFHPNARLASTWQPWDGVLGP